MANLNLSQFTEKLFVADADHTFIWDTAGTISKRVSRNSWLNSGTLTSDAPVTISQTWNGTGSTVFTALKVNATTPGTTSSSSSLLLDLQVGGTSKITAKKSGTIFTSAGSVATGGGIGANGLALEMVFPGYGLGVDNNGSTQFLINSIARARVGLGIVIASDQSLSFSDRTHTGLDCVSDTILLRDGAPNTLALRNGANAQTFNVYGTYTSGTSYERLTLSAPSAANAIIGTNKGSGGGTARGLEFQTDGVSRLTFNGVGQAAFTNSLTAAAVFYLGAPHYNTFASSASGVIKISNVSESDFNRLQFGGTTSAFPSIKRNSTTLQARLADDSAFAPIQGKLTTDTAYTATVVAATGYITIYDSTGAAYRVPCAV